MMTIAAPHMKDSLSCESSSSSVSQEIPQISVGPKGSLLCSQETATGSYPAPDESSLNLQILYLWSSF
jgi:hypothetical protein